MKLTTKNQDPKNYTEATAILHKIGNQKPYFSLTGRVVEKGRESVSGAIHDEILKACPKAKLYVFGSCWISPIIYNSIEIFLNIIFIALIIRSSSN